MLHEYTDSFLKYYSSRFQAIIEPSLPDVTTFELSDSQQQTLDSKPTCRTRGFLTVGINK
uniref:Uncharacterized protein n=1 Tax=Romanomermis culicivorax TaxID=13658 RepID=A0A915KFT4_ROMCU